MQNSNPNSEKENVYPAKLALGERSGVIPAQSEILFSPLLFVLLFIVIFILGIFLGKTFFSSEKRVFITSSFITPSPTITEATSGGEMAGWKIYTNETIGFSLKIPQDYTVTSESQDGGVNILNKNNFVIRIGAVDSNGLSSDFLKDTENYFKEVGLPLLSARMIKINGTDAIYSKYSQMGGGEAYFLLNNGKRIMIDKQPTVTSKQQEFDQILSTFKFIEKSPVLTLYSTDYLKKQVSFSDKFDSGKQENYPMEITALKDADLVGMKCSSFHQKNYGGGWVNEESEYFLNKIYSFEKLVIKKDVTKEYQICETEDQRQIVQYDDNIGLFDKDNNFSVVTTLGAKGDIYFVCPKPLLLTKDNRFYYQCGSGDGAMSIDYLFKIDLSNKTQSLIKKCVNAPDETAPGKTAVKCT